MLDTLVRRFLLPANAKAEIVRPCQQDGHCPTVSVIIPCYNYGRYLKECLNSVLEQQGVCLDVIIIDDASSDGSDQIVRRLGAQDTRIRTICHAANQGHIATYNEGIAEVIGDYTVLLSADDLLTPGCLARATSLMEEHPSVGLTYGFPVEFWDGDLPSARTTTARWIIWQGCDWIAQICKTGENAIKCPEAIMRTSILREIGGYRASLPHAADFDLWMRAAAISDIGYVVGADQAYYRNHVSNMHHSTFDILDDLSERLTLLDTFFSECSEMLKDPDSMRDIAHRALARNALRHAIRDTAHLALARSALRHAIPRYSRGGLGHEPVGDYAVFALKAWPDARNLDEWRTFDRLFNVRDGLPRLDPSLITRMTMRKLRTRFTYWRRRWAGM